MRRRKTKQNQPFQAIEPSASDLDDAELDELDSDAPLELDEEYWEALIPDDDYEPHPEPGDFWPD